MNAQGSERLDRYRLLASSIAGRLVDVASGAPGEPAWTDGTTVFVDAGASPRERVVSLAVQASLLGAGSLDADVLGRLARRPSLARRYLAVEGHRALAAQELLPAAARSLVDLTVAARSESPATSLAVAAGRDAIADPPDAFGIIRPRRVRVSVERGPHDQAAAHVPRTRREDALHDLDDDGDEGVAFDVFSSPVGGGGALGRVLKRLFRDTRSEGAGPPGADAPTHRTKQSVGVSRTTTVTTARPAAAGEMGPVERHETTYPEWDTFRHRYRPSWCTVVEVDAAADDLASLTVPDPRSLRRSLGRLGIGLDRSHRQLQGDDVDLDAAIEAYVEVRAGSAPDEAVYVDSVRRRRDLSVLVLLDISGSAGEPGATGAIVHEHQRAAAAALTVALHDLGDRVALYAFRSQGRSAVTVVRVKRFDDALDAAVLQRLGGLVPAAYTRLGAAIRHGASVLERDGGTPRRLLVVLSDGFAYDHGYEGAYGEADARRALAEARRRGTGCLCLSIGATTDAAALRRVFGSAAHATIPRAEQLPDVVGPLFRAALGSAEVQRRAWQRTVRARERLHVERSTA